MLVRMIMKRRHWAIVLLALSVLFSCVINHRNGVTCFEHRQQKRWVDVDDDDNQQTRSVIRQQTPNLGGGIVQPPPGVDASPADLNGLSNFVKDFDQGIGQRFESINDISNLRSLETNEQSIEPGPMMPSHGAADNRETLDAVPGSVATLPLLASPQQEQFVNGLRGDERDLSLPPSVLTMNNCADNSAIVEGCGPPRLPIETPVADTTSVSAPDHAFHTPDHNEILVPQGNIFQPGPPEERVEPEIHRQSDEPIEHRLVPGRTVYLRPMHVVQGARHVFKHMHHRPHFFLIHRTRRRRPRLSESRCIDLSDVLMAVMFQSSIY